MTKKHDPQSSLSAAWPYSALLSEIATREVVCLGLDRTLFEAAAVMSDRRISSVVAIDGAGHPQGVVTERDLLRALEEHLTRDTQVGKFMSTPVVKLPPATSIEAAYQIALREGVRHVVLVDEHGVVAGVASETDFRLHLNLSLLAGRRTVSSAMEHTILSLPPEASIEQAIQLMERRRASCVVVVEQEAPVGIITERDITRLFAVCLNTPDRPLREIMTHPVSTIAEGSTINEAAEKMLAIKARHLVVDNSGLLIGLLGEHELLRTLNETLLDAKLGNERAYLRALFDAIPDPVWLKNPDGVYLACNMRLGQLSGIPSTQMAGKTDVELLGQTQANACRKSDWEALQTGRPTVGEEWMAFPGGYRGLFEITKTPMRDADGAWLGVLGVACDITERRQGERREKARADFLDAMVRGEPLPALLKRLVHALEAQIDGTACSILLYNPTTNTLHIGAAPNLPDFYNQAVEGLQAGVGVGACGTAACEGRRVVCEDLQTHPYWQPYKEIVARAGLGACWSEPITDASGKVLGTFAVYGSQPRTPMLGELESLGWAAQLACLAIERRTMERRLEENEAHFRTLADSGQALVWTSGLDKRRDYFNRPWLDFTGHRLEQAQAEGCLESIHPEDRERFWESYARAFDRREHFSLDYRLRRHDGEYRWIQAEGAPRYDSLGEFAGFIGHCLDVTERKQAQQELEESRAHLQRILELAPLPMCYADGSGRIVFRNQRFLKLIGYTEEEMPTLAEWWLLAYPDPEYRQQVLDQWGLSIESARYNNGEFKPVTYQVACKDGEVRILEISKIMLGEGILATFINLTDRVRAEESLREKEAYLRAIFENEPQCIKLLSRDATLLDMNPAGLAMIEAESLDQVRGQKVCPLVSEKDRPQFLAMVEAVFRGEAQHLVFETIGLKGTRRCLETYSVPLWDSRHLEVQTLLGVTQDITERKQAAAKIRESEECYRLLVEQSVEGILVHDEQLRYVEANPSACRILGYSREEILSLSVTDMIDPGELERVQPDVGRFAAGETTPSEYRCKRKNGEVFIGEVTGSQLPDGRFLGILRDITERKQFEAILKESETRFRALFESSPDALVLANPQGFVQCNLATLQMFGCTRPEEFLGKHPADFSPPTQPGGGNSKALALERMEQAFQGQKAPFEWQHRRLNGEEFPAEVLLSPVILNGEPMLYAVLRDISERKHMEERLRESQANLQMAMEKAPYGILLIGRDRSIDYLNLAVTQIFGYEQSALPDIETVFEKAYPDPTYRQEVLRLWQQNVVINEQLSHTPDIGQVFKVTRRDGVQRDVEFHVIRLPDDRLMITVSDITEKKALESQLERHREHLQELVTERTKALESAYYQLGETFDAMGRAGIAVYWVDIHTGRLLEVNDRTCQMLGYRREELLTLSVPDLDPNYPPEGYTAVMAKVVQERRVCIETVNRHKEGHLIPVEMTIYLPEAEAGQSKRIVAFITDISLRKEAEQALVDARQTAEAASRAKSEFLANMSHEIRTPLNAILGLSRLLEQAGLTPPQQDLVGKIRTSSDSLLCIINEILDFSKIEAGQMQIEQAPFRLGKLLDKLAILGSAAIGHKDIEFVIGPVPAGAGFLKGDALRLEQVLVNLIGNAAKFTPQGEIRLDIAVVRTWDRHLELRFALSDTGIGIEPKQLQHIFTPFSQADGSTTRRFGGTGLGLSICQRLVALMGGEIGVESQPDQGSVFWFTVRLEVADPESVPEPDLPRQRVLVVDDHPGMLASLVGIVRNLGWEVEAETSGEAAVERFARRAQGTASFDIILMDWKMPGMDGLAACQAIRMLQGSQAAPILIMVTAYERERLAAEPGIGSADAFLSKPLTASSLHEAVALAKAARQPARHTIPTAGPQRLAGWRILVTDDNEINRDVAQLSLESEGAAVHLAVNGQQALDWLTAHPGGADAVLMDVQMPVMDGYEATRRIRQNPALKGLPIVALSAGVFKEHQEAALAAGMDSFIGKPFDPDEMVNLLLFLGKNQRRPDGFTEAAALSEATTEAVALDIDKALRLWKTPEKYQDKLRQFLDTHGQDQQTITRLIAQGELTDAKAQTHRLKGVAGNLALLELQQRAGQLEAELKLGVVAEASLRALELAMARAAESIGVYANTATGAGDAAATAQLLQELQAALALYSPGEAEPCLAALAERVSDDRLQAIREALDEFDFPEAQALVCQLTEALGVSSQENF